MIRCLPIVLLLAVSPVVGQESISKIEQNVRDIAGIAIENKDSLTELRNRVASIETMNTEVLSRLSAVENKVFGIGTPAVTSVDVCPDEVVLSSTPVVMATPVYYAPVQQAEPVIVRSRTVTRVVPQRRQMRTPVRSFLGLFSRRRVTTQPVNRSGSNWSYPGNLSSHLTGSPHYLSPSYVNSLAYGEQLSLHNSLHNGF